MSISIHDKYPDFFEHCYHLSNEYLKVFSCEGNDEWDNKKFNIYCHGIILGLYRESDSELLKIIHQNEPIDNDSLYLLCCDEVDKYNINSQEIHKKCYFDDNISGFSYPLKNENLVSWYQSFNCFLIKDLIDNGENEITVSNFLLVYLTFEKLKVKRNNDLKVELPAIHALYDGKILDKDFTKWALIPIRDQRELLPLFPTRIWDKNIRKTIFTDFDKSFALLINKLLFEGKIGSFSVRANNDVYDDYYAKEYLQEALERGRNFELNISSLPDITKLYDEKEYENQLWIKKTDSDITFEELDNHYKCDDNVIESQVVHLEYKKQNCIFVITHIDHERVFYSKEEFEVRKTKIIKGSEQKRIKSFKINDAQIPFDYPCEIEVVESSNKVPFLFYILNYFFKHKELITEYFNTFID